MVCGALQINQTSGEHIYIYIIFFKKGTLRLIFDGDVEFVHVKQGLFKQTEYRIKGIEENEIILILRDSTTVLHTIILFSQFLKKSIFLCQLGGVRAHVNATWGQNRTQDKNLFICLFFAAYVLSSLPLRLT